MELCLSQWLGIDQIILMLKTLADQLLFIQPDKPENRGYVDLLYELFPQILTNICQTRMNFLQQYFKMIVEKQIPTPRSYNELTEQLAKLACASWRPHIPPAWTEQTTKIIEQWLGKISFEERQFIHKRFGMDTTPMTLRVVGIQCGNITGAAAKHRIIKIIDTLKNLINPRQVQLFLQPSYLVNASVLNPKKHILDSGIEILELSSATKRRLNKHKILWINDLVQKSESELLRLPRIGRGTIRLIKSALRLHNLALREPLKKIRQGHDSQFSRLQGVPGHTQSYWSNSFIHTI